MVAAVSSTPVTEVGGCAASVVLCSSMSSPELNGGAKHEAGGDQPAHQLHAASESSSDTGDLMFSELEVFADENNPSHVDENSNEENDVDDETMSGENDIEAARALSAESAGGSGADILRRLVCAVATRGVTPAGTDGSAPPSHAPHRHDLDPQLSTAAHTDMLLLNLMRMNGLTPKHSRHGGKRQWNRQSGSPQSSVFGGRRNSAGAAGATGAGRRPPGAASSATRSRRLPQAPHSHSSHSHPHSHAPLSPGQLARGSDHSHSPGLGATPPGTPELHDYWPSVASDSDDVDVVLDYNVNNDVTLNDTLFDMLLNSLSIDSPGSPGGAGAGGAGRAATPPVAPWSPAPAERGERAD